MHLVRFTHSPDVTPYPEALARMEANLTPIAHGEMPEQLWFLEHPPLYTAGTSAKATDLLETRFPVFDAGRGGQYTYHGPGQRVAYLQLDLHKRPEAKKGDVRAFVQDLEEWIIRTLAAFDIQGERREGRIGVWVEKPDGREAKIAALGIRVRRWITYHGIAINLNPDLSHFEGIVPCGIRQFGVTSFADLGKTVTMEALDTMLKKQFATVFEPMEWVSSPTP